MPLITKLLPALERVREQQADTKSLRALERVQDSDSVSLRARTDDEYDSYDSGEEEEISEASVMNLTRPRKIAAPALPQRSDRRASTMFENLKINTKLPDADKDSMRSQLENEASDPYASYVSSEEDASESADDYDESFV